MNTKGAQWKTIQLSGVGIQRQKHSPEAVSNMKRKWEESMLDWRAPAASDTRSSPCWPTAKTFILLVWSQSPFEVTVSRHQVHTSLICKVTPYLLSAKAPAKGSISARLEKKKISDSGDLGGDGVFGVGAQRWRWLALGGLFRK